MLCLLKNWCEIRCLNVSYIKVIVFLWDGIIFCVSLPSIIYNGLNTEDKILNDICSYSVSWSLFALQSHCAFRNSIKTFYIKDSFKAMWTLESLLLVHYHDTILWRCKEQNPESFKSCKGYPHQWKSRILRNKQTNKQIVWYVYAGAVQCQDLSLRF